MDWKKVISNNAKKVQNKNMNITYPRYPAQSGGKKSCKPPSFKKNKKGKSSTKGQCGGGSSSSSDEVIEVGSSTLTFMTLICIIGMVFMMGLVIYLLWNNNSRITENMYDTPLSNDKSSKVDLNIRIRNDEPDVPNTNLISYPEYIVDKSYERLANPLLPPERSYELAYGVPINIPSRGYVGGYQQLGHLFKTEVANSNVAIGNNSDTTILPLFGRPIYNGSKKWTYYTSTDKVNMIKLPISVNGRKCDQDIGCNEIYSGDKINLPPYNGTFTVEIYDYDKPRYIPYAF
jgi:hypothetical protein